MDTVNVNIFILRAVHICRALDTRKLDVSENCNHTRTNRNKWYVRKNLTTRICLVGLDAQKSSCAKISTFTVIIIGLECLDIPYRKRI